MELILFSLACLESAVYGHVDGSVLLSFSCSGFALKLFYRCALSPFWCEPFLRSASLGQGVILNRQVFLLLQNLFYSLSFPQNSVIKFETQIEIKFNFQSISHV
jgi:hypothetical protein